MKPTFVLISIAFMIASCAQPENSITERENEPDIYYVEGTDSEMNKAMEEANESFDLFQEYFHSAEAKKYYYSIKLKFRDSKGSFEHIWIGDITSDKSGYTGVVENTPFAVPMLEYGDTVKIEENRISDWMVVEHITGEVYGGYTLRVLRDRMTPAEQTEFDSSTGLRFNP